MVTHESDQPILKRFSLAPEEINDAACENFAWVVCEHLTPQGNKCTLVNVIVYPNETTEEWSGIGIWTCPRCGSSTTVFIPVNSEMEE